MEPSALQKLATELLVVIATMTGYDAPEVLPAIELLSGPSLQERLCTRPCPVYAYYRPGRQILLDRDLDPVHNSGARSILLHELVHYVQWSHHGRGPNDCTEWQARENEAYLVQFRYLSTQPPTGRGLVPRRPPLATIVCRAENGAGAGDWSQAYASP